MRASLRTLLVGAVLLTGCSTPQLVAPPNNPDPVVLPTVESSVVNIPIRLDLETIRTETLKNVPKPLSIGTVQQSIGIGTADITHYLSLRDLRLNMTGAQFSATAQLDFAVDTKLRSFLQIGGISCGTNGEDPARVEFTLPGTLYWTQTGDLAIQPGQWQLKWLRPCNITALKLSVEKLLDLPMVRDKVQTLVSQNINEALKQVALKAMLARAWPQLNEPQKLEEGVWLLLQPQQIGLADIQGNGRYVSTAISVTARPQVLSGDKPKITLPPLPQPQRLTSTQDTFHVALRGDIGLDTANKLLNDKLAGKPIDANGHQVLIDSIQFYGSGSKAVLALRLSKPIQGEIHLLGKPVFDVASNEVRLEEVEFALATSSLLAKSANWMLHDTVKQAIMDKARFNFDKELGNTLKDFQDYRQDLGHGAVLRAQLGSVRPQGLFFTKEDLKVFVVADGKLSLDVSNGKP